MKFVKKETAIPGKTVKVRDAEGNETEEKVKLEIEVPEYESAPEFINAAGGETGLLVFGNQKVAEAGASAFRVAFTAAIKDKKTEEEAIAAGRAASKAVKPAVRGPSKKEVDAQKDAEFKEMIAAALSGKLSKERTAELAAKYGVSA